MEDQARFEKLLVTARETVLWVLNDAGALFPMAMSLDDEGADVKVYSPRDEHPDADWGQLLEVATASLRQQVASGGVSGIALVTPLENEGQMGAGVQVETAGNVLLLIFPYVQQDDGFGLGEPLAPDSLLVDRFF